MTSCKSTSITQVCPSATHGYIELLNTEGIPAAPTAH